MELLECSQVDFSYSRRKDRKVFDAFDWAVVPGATTLLLGPNGAGKSTLLKLLCGQLSPDRGRVLYNEATMPQVLFEHVGWMPQHIRAARGLTAEEQLQYAAWACGNNSKESHALASRALEMVELKDQARSRADQLSGGQLRRLGLAQACVRQRATILLLDEPTAGLDPAQSINFRRLLDRLDYPDGIVVSTHQVADLADHVDRIAVLAEGMMLFDGSVEDFVEHGRRLGVTSGSLSDVFTNMVQGGMH